MTSKTWFLSPNFNFLPDGQIALGRIIPSPQRPTVTLASFTDDPSISLPEITSIPEKNHSFSTKKGRAFGLELFSSFLDMASANGKADVSWNKDLSFSAVDHEVRMYNGVFAKEALQKIVKLDGVKRHMEGGRFGKRCVYIISGIRIAQQSFTVTDEKGRKMETSIGGSCPVPAGAVPVTLGGHVAGSREDTRANGYETAPGIVFAYQLHVIRPKGDGVEVELFSHRTAFFSGEGENEDDEGEEMEVVEVNGAVLREDLDVKLDSYCEERVEGYDESYVVFGS